MTNRSRRPSETVWQLLLYDIQSGLPKAERGQVLAVACAALHESNLDSDGVNKAMSAAKPFPEADLLPERLVAVLEKKACWEDEIMEELAKTDIDAWDPAIRSINAPDEIIHID